MVNLFRIADQHSTTQLAALYTDRCKPLGWSNLTWRTTAVLNLMELEYSYLLSAKTRLSGDYMAVFYKFKTYITICLLWRNTNSNSVLNFCESLLFWSWLFPCLLKKKKFKRFETWYRRAVSILWYPVHTILYKFPKDSYNVVRYGRRIKK